MDLAALKAFTSVAQNQSFSAAAKALHLSQPAISKRIANLEAQLGTELFDRLGRTVRLTEAGALLLRHSATIEQQIADLHTEIGNLSEEVRGPLRIATSHHIGLHHLPRYLRDFSQAYPDAELDIHFVDSEEAYDLLLNGRADLAVVTLDPHGVYGVSDLDQQLLWQDPLVFAAAKDVALRAPGLRAAQISLETLVTNRAVLPGPGTFTGRIVNTLLQQRGLQLHGALRTNYLETIRMLAAVGLGWTVLPETMIDDSLAILEVSIGDDPGAESDQDRAQPKLMRELGLVTHPTRTLSIAAQRFVQMLGNS